eukprot:TRINITY_DN19175_c0_g1_i2.p1 TRINITY_DN19175_c0_g1~~TRINITY_DN19175_c0_g1_i2.p1  ORF type:complete len:567 (-),score=116.05 TRINITY_DN19175_c0_g1_i2:145-1791(-)
MADRPISCHRLPRQPWQTPIGLSLRRGAMYDDCSADFSASQDRCPSRSRSRSRDHVSLSDSDSRRARVRSASPTPQEIPQGSDEDLDDIQKLDAGQHAELFYYSGMCYDDMFTLMDKSRDTMITKYATGESRKGDEFNLEKDLEQMLNSEVNTKLQEAKHTATPEATDAGTEVDDAKFWEDAKAKNFVFAASGSNQNPMAGRWARCLKRSAQLKEDYKNCGSTHAEKAKFRQDWAEKQYDEYMATKSHTRTHEQIWTKEGRYLAIGRIAWLEGGGSAGWRAAINYCSSCVSLGGRWVKFDSKARRLKFCYEEEKYEERYTEAWKQHEEWRTKLCTAKPAVTAGAGPQKHDDAAGTEKVGTSGRGAAAATATPKAAGKKRKAVPTDGAGEDDEAGTPSQAARAKAKAKAAASKKQPGKNADSGASSAHLVKDVKSLKLSYGATTAQATTMLAMIDKNKSWGWIKECPTLVTPLRDALKAVEDVAMASEFIGKFLTTDATELKRKEGASAYEVGIKSVKDVLEGPLKELTKQCRVLQDQQESKMKHEVDA